MSEYLLIQSRDPFESKSVGAFYDLASRLAGSGNGVTLFLVQDGVSAARESEASAPLGSLKSAGVDILADDLALGERGIDAGSVVAGVKASSLDVVVDKLAAGVKAIWN